MRIILAVVLLVLIAVLMVAISNSRSGCDRVAQAYCRGSKDSQCYVNARMECAKEAR